MRQRLKNALALLEHDSIEQLIQGFLAVKHHHQRFSALMVAMLNASEGRLDCYHRAEKNQYVTARLDASIEDVNHPLVRVLRNGVPEMWRSLNQGVRIEDDGFREFIQELPLECGLHVLPLFDFSGRACGVIAVFAEEIARFADVRGMFSIYCQIFQHRLSKLQERDQLRMQLSQIRCVFAAQQEREKQLSELLSSFNTTQSHPQPGLSHDYSKINNLMKAVEVFECGVLTQRQNLYGNDRNRMAASLGLTPRALAYKLAKYRC